MTHSKVEWRAIQLGDILTYLDEKVALDDDKEYLTIRVKRRHGGLEMREKLFGHEIKTKKQFRLIPGSFIVSRIQCWHQAYAFVGDVPNNAIASTNYDQFAISSDVHPRFFWWLSFTPEFTETVRSSASGVVIEKMVFDRNVWLEKTVKIPPIQEQQRIVERIDELAIKIHEARNLKEETKWETDRFWKVLSRIARQTNYPERTLDEMAEFLDGQRVPLSVAQRESRKGPYPYYGASRVIDHIDDYLFDEPLLLLSEDGANLTNKSMPIAFVATGKYWVNNHAHVLRPREGIADLHFLTYALSDYDVSAFNFASAQAKLNQKNARQICFPLPPLSEQGRIVAELNALQEQVDALKCLQAETTAELDSLLPSIISHAFKVELEGLSLSQERLI